MSQSVHPETRNFICDHCGGEIRIPYDLPPLSAPCPHCSVAITSPPPPDSGDAVDAPSIAPEADLVSKHEGKGDQGAGDTLKEEKEAEEKKAEEKEAEEKEAEEKEAEEKEAREKEAEEKKAEEKEAKEKEAKEKEAKEKEAKEKEAREKEAEEKEAKEKEAREREVTEREAVERLAAERVSAALSLEDKAAPDELIDGESLESGRRSMAPMMFLVAVLILAGLVALGVFLLRADSRDVAKGKGSQAAIEEARFIRDGWKGVATEVLRGFLSAGDLSSKAKFVIGGSSRLEEMEVFYAEVPMDDADTPLSAFSHHNLDLADREAGIFLMQYERPSQFDIREFFRPVAPLEVRYNVDEPDLLLSGVAKLENFAMEPVKAMAFFKRGEGESLLLDWDTFVQTKYRTLNRFSGFPARGSSGVFRVLMQEDIPDLSMDSRRGARTYRAIDPGNNRDYVKVQVPVDSEVGRVLASLNWIGVERTELPSRTATVELAWSDESDSKLELRRVICWEFLGLGGKEGNTEVPVPQPMEDNTVVPVSDAAVSGRAGGVETSEP